MSEALQEPILELINSELSSYRPKQIRTVLTLLSEGNTVPFIARYRKEMTGTLDEVQIREIEERYQYLVNLEKRKEEITRLIAEQEKLTDDLANSIKSAVKMQQLEDIYRPFKQKRRTKATIAKEKGLEPFANWLLSFPSAGNVYEEAADYISDEKEVLDAEAVLQGAHEIIAEKIGDEPKFRTWIRAFTFKNGVLASKAKKIEEDEKGVYEMYYDFSEPLKKLVSHRILATNRGEKEGILKIELDVPELEIFQYLNRQLIGKNQESISAPFIKESYQDSYKRFIGPAIEREIRNELSEKADEQAIRIFGENLYNLLLQPPLKGKIVLGFGPAYRTGCKLAVVDPTGKVLAIQVIYPHKPASESKRQNAGRAFVELIEKYQVEMVAIGNGTASR